MSMFQKPEGDTSNQPSITIIAEGSLIKGSISVTSDFRLAGNIEGNVTSEGKCIIASTATVLGNIVSPDSDIAGTVTGNLTVNQKLILRKTAVIKGDIRTNVFLVEEGARVDGTIVMSRNGG
jgi:cytoskeletal protein CcmA (bactofilin family)